MLIRRTLIFLVAAFVGLLIPSWVMTGCSRSNEPTPAAPAGSGAKAPVEVKADAPDYLPGQTTCPVMGNPVDKTIFTLHKGKKVYFCCKPCIEKFDAEPEKYVPKLK